MRAPQSFTYCYKQLHPVLPVEPCREQESARLRASTWSRTQEHVCLLPTGTDLLFHHGRIRRVYALGGSTGVSGISGVGGACRHRFGKVAMVANLGRRA